jgi:histidine triad (HIT) family protein
LEEQVDDCIFCQILAGKAPASIVYKDEVCTAFMDIHPVNPGHVLVVPNQHSANLSELDEATGAQLFHTAKRLAETLRRSGIRCQGVNLFLADGQAAGQEVFHVHLHILPRFAGDGFGFRFGPDYAHRPSRDELDEIARRLREAQ